MKHRSPYIVLPTIHRVISLSDFLLVHCTSLHNITIPPVLPWYAVYFWYHSSLGLTHTVSTPWSKKFSVVSDVLDYFFFHTGKKINHLIWIWQLPWLSPAGFCLIQSRSFHNSILYCIFCGCGIVKIVLPHKPNAPLLLHFSSCLTISHTAACHRPYCGAKWSQTHTERPGKPCWVTLR